jgi:hypothetical protein
LQSIKLVLIFVWHILAGSVLFVVVCFAVIGLSLFTRWTGSIGIPIYITHGGELLAYFVFTIDVICFVVFVIKEAVVLVRRIIAER